jgi:hypothetical protein
MNIIIVSSHIQFKNPQIGQPTRAVEEHYNGRRITALVDGEERIFRFKKEELPFDIDEDDMVEAIERRLSENS